MSDSSLSQELDPRVLSRVVSGIAHSMPEVRSVVTVGRSGVQLVSLLAAAGFGPVIRLEDIDPIRLAAEATDPMDFERWQRLAAAIPQCDLLVSLDHGTGLDDQSAVAFVALATSRAPRVLMLGRLPRNRLEAPPTARWHSYWGHLFGQRGMYSSPALRNCVWYDALLPWRLRQDLMLFADDSLGMEECTTPDVLHPSWLDGVDDDVDLNEPMWRDLIRLSDEFDEEVVRGLGTAQELRSLLGQLREREQEVLSLAAENNRLRALELQLSSVYGSRSWRWTRLLRREPQTQYEKEAVVG